MNRGVLLSLLLCVVLLCATADRRRPDQERHPRHHRDTNDDDDDEPRIVHLADYESDSWQHDHSTWKPKERKHSHDHPPPTKGQWKGKDKKKNGDNGQRHQSEDERHDGNSDRRRDQENRDGEYGHRTGRNQYDGKDRKKEHQHQQGRHQSRQNDDRNREYTPREHHNRRPNGEQTTAYTHTSGTAQTSHSVSPPSGVEQPSDEDHVSVRPSEEPSPTVPDVAEDTDPSPADEVETAPPAWSGDPPPHEDVAAMARYIVHVSDWAAMATISTRPATLGAPFANVFSVADGTKYRSTGVPYMYLTDWEISVKDLRANNKASLTMSLAQSGYCAEHQYDPESPLCAHVILSGTVRQVDESEPDYTFAHDALFTRHPAMAGWPASHEWFVAMLEIEDIIVLDYFGGAITVSKEDYFAASPFTVKEGRSSNGV